MRTDADCPGVVEMLDERFAACAPADAALRRLHTGCSWAEGPVWLPADGSLVWSDTREDRMLRWDEAGGAVTVFREPSRFANGNTLDRQGRLVTCEHGERRVVRTEPDGSLTVLADSFDGRRLNSPNDVVVRSDGSVWFSDPTYGIDSDEEGHRAESEIGASHVYRVDPDTGACEIAADDFVRPNGLAFSPDERLLYVSDTGQSHMPDGPRHLRVFAAGDTGKLSGGDVFATCPTGVFDGFKVDADGRVWTSSGEGVHCYDPDGTLLGMVRLPETAANVAFGGPGRNRLFVTATSSVYAIDVTVVGASGPGR